MSDELKVIIENFIIGNIEEKKRMYTVKSSIENINNLKDMYVYNEFSFQHELGNYLRDKNYNVKFEYNVINLSTSIQTCKKEIDILILDRNGKAKYAIELKYLKKGSGVPKRMFHCVEDMRFMKDVVTNIPEIKSSYCVVITEDHNFYNGSCEESNEKLLYDKKDGYLEYKESMSKKLEIQKKLAENKKIQFSNHKNKTLKKQIEDLENEIKYLDNQRAWSEELTDKSKIINPPNIYEYFRGGKVKDKWETANYVYNNSKDSLSIISVEDFKDEVKKQLTWYPVPNNINNEVKYYILRFDKKNKNI